MRICYLCAKNMPNSSASATGEPANSLASAVYQNIARQIREGSCVLLLGPHAMMAKQSDGSFKPATDLCAMHIGRDLNLPPEEARSLSYVTSTLRLKGSMSDTLILAAVQDFYQKMEKEATLLPQLEKLADLPFRIIVNTAPDEFLNRYFAQSVRDFRGGFYNFRKPNPDPLFQFGDEQAPLIYNLFGTYKKPESLVLTYTDQLNYVNKITGAQHERLPDSLLAAFNVPRFYLFIGFDFDDWTLRLLCDVLFKNARNNITPFAYPHRDTPPAESGARVFFQSEFKMEFPEVDMESFIDNLLQHYAALDGPGPSGPVDAGNARANVLILHNGPKEIDDASTALIRHLTPLKVRTLTLRDATAGGDQAAWIRQQFDQVQVVLPLISADFFDPANPCLAVLDELVQRNNPRSKFLVMPLVLKSFSLEGTPLGALKTTRPTNGAAIYGEGKEDSHFAAIVQALKNYLDSI